jgi:hypothetical protein
MRQKILGVQKLKNSLGIVVRTCLFKKIKNKFKKL